MTYRESDEPSNRVATIAIARPRSWRVGMTFALLFVIGGLVTTFALTTGYRFACTRDDDGGEGSCTYEERRVVGTVTRRWSGLRDARVDVGRQSFVGQRYIAHLVVVMDDGEHVLFDVGSKTAQAVRATALKLFIADVSRREVHVEDDDGTWIYVSLFLAGFGFLLLWGVNVQFPARRLVVDEASGTALFEARTWRTWREDATMDLGEVAAIERRITSYEPDRDDALVALRGFLRR